MKVRVVALIFLMFVSHLYAVEKGSETVISSEPFFVFPSADIDNAIRGFAWMDAGFALEDLLTTCTFGSFFPARGIVQLNSGTLWLTRDLILHNSTTFTSLGNIRANPLQSLALASAMTSLGAESATVHTFENINIELSSNIVLDSYIQFFGNSSIDGNGHVLDMNSTGSLIVASNSSLALKDMTIAGIHDSNIVCTDESSRLILNKIKWMQSSDYTFDIGTILFQNNVDFVGSYTFAYASSRTSTIEAFGCWHVGDGMKLRIGRDPISLEEPLYLTDETSVFKLDNCNFILTDSGMSLTNGKLVVENEVAIDMLGTTTQTGLVFGDGNADHDVTIAISPGASISHNSGYWVYNNGAADKFISSSKVARLIRDVNSQVYVPHSFAIQNVCIDVLSVLVAPVEIEPGRLITYNNAIVRLPGIETEITASQAQAYVYLLNGNCSIFLTKGTLPIFLVVSGAGNELLGNGSMSQPITLSDSGSYLTISLNGFIGNTIMLNEGTLSLGNDISLSGDGRIIGPGTVSVGTNNVRYCQEAQTEATSLLWQGSGGGMLLRGKTSLSRTWTINGKITIDGRGSELVLASGGELVINTDSKLVLKNIRISGITGENIRCVNSGGVLSLVNTELLQSGDFSFSNGSINFSQENLVSGAYTFSYDSSCTSTIAADARWQIKGGNVALGRNGGIEPLYFEDSTAIIQFSDSTFYVKNSGMRMTRGTIAASRDVVVDIQSTSTANGLIFGDGTIVGDSALVLNAGATVRFPSGHVLYDITRADGIRSKTQSAQLIRGAGSVFHLNQNLSLSDMTLDVDVASQLSISAGKTLNYSNGRIVIGQTIFDLTGVRYSDVATLLNGNDRITMIGGTLPLATLVNGTGNSIEGNGNILGPIILLNSNAALTLSFNGMLFASPTLNGGTITLGSDVTLGNNVLFAGNGVVDIRDDSLYFGSQPLSWIGNTYWSGTGGAMHINGNISLVGTWTFSGSSVLHGRNQAIDLGATGNIVVDSNSSLTLHNVKLLGINTNNIRCVDDTGVISLGNSEWHQVEGSNFAFDYGALRFNNKVVMGGNDSTFVYHTSQTSTICSESKLILDTGFTFSYDPGIASKNLIEFEDESSKLILKSASLHTTATGMQLTKGQLEVKGDSYLSSDKVIVQAHVPRMLNEGIMFGGGAVADNFPCLIIGGASLSLTKGTLVYNNMNPNLLMIENKMSLLHIAQEARLVLDESLQISTGGIEFGDHATLMIKNGRSLAGSVFPLGYLHRMSKS